MNFAKIHSNTEFLSTLWLLIRDRLHTFRCGIDNFNLVCSHPKRWGDTKLEAVARVHLPMSHRRFGQAVAGKQGHKHACVADNCNILCSGFDTAVNHLFKCGTNSLCKFRIAFAIRRFCINVAAYPIFKILVIF